VSERVYPREPQLCLECGTSLASKRRDALTCSSRCRSRRSRRLRWQQLSPNVRFRRVEASPDDPMFSKLNIAFISDPVDPDGAAETNGHPEPPKRRFRGLKPVDPDEPWTIHIGLTPPSS
jgi:hypothetical protein